MYKEKTLEALRKPNENTSPNSKRERACKYGNEMLDGRLAQTIENEQISALKVLNEINRVVRS